MQWAELRFPAINLLTIWRYDMLKCEHTMCNNHNSNHDTQDLSNCHYNTCTATPAQLESYEPKELKLDIRDGVGVSSDAELTLE
jgi:hypothetical protein